MARPYSGVLLPNRVADELDDPLLEGLFARLLRLARAHYRDREGDQFTASKRDLVRIVGGGHWGNAQRRLKRLEPWVYFKAASPRGTTFRVHIVDFERSQGLQSIPVPLRAVGGTSGTRGRHGEDTGGTRPSHAGEHGAPKPAESRDSGANNSPLTPVGNREQGNGKRETAVSGHLRDRSEAEALREESPPGWLLDTLRDLDASCELRPEYTGVLEHDPEFFTKQWRFFVQFASRKGTPRNLRAAWGGWIRNRYVDERVRRRWGQLQSAGMEKAMRMAQKGREPERGEPRP